MSAITKEMVFEAANALAEAGLPTKVATVREKLGKGSYTTINEYMRVWREGQKPQEAPAKEVAPQAVTDRLLAFGNEMWEAAVGMATETLKGEREALETMKSEMDEEQRETVAFADNLANELELLRAKNEELQGMMEIEKVSHEATRNMYQHEIDMVIKLTAELEAAQRRNEDLKEENRSNRSLLDQANIHRDRLVETDRKQAAEIAKLEGKLEEIRSQHKRDQESITAQLDKLEAERDKAIEESKKVQAAAQADRIGAAKLEGEIKTLNKQIEQQAKLIDKFAPSKKEIKNNEND